MLICGKNLFTKYYTNMGYKFTFANVGGATRVKIQSGDDIRHLRELDEKMWTAQSCPVAGLEMDEADLKLMDLDNDGFIHVTEVVRTAEWLCGALNDAETLMQATDKIALSNIKDEALLAVATEVAAGKDAITLADVDAVIGAISVEEESVPDAPFEADVIAAYKEKSAEYPKYYELKKLEKIGLATIPEDMLVPGMKEDAFIKMGAEIADWEGKVAAITAANAAKKEAAVAVYMPLRKLVVLHRVFIRFLRNFVTFDQFYKREHAIFQAGTLVIDQRACHLIVRVCDAGKQDAQAPASGMFLVYCDCTSKTGAKMNIVAAVTMGEIRNLTVGKNAIFYDWKGEDWNATITKVIDNPISIRQAFWSPYRKFAKWVTDLINKSASEKNDKAFADMTAKAEGSLNNPDAAAGEAPKKSAFDIAKFAGIFAAIGMALGYIGKFLTDVARGVADAEWWQILVAIAAIMLVISGPAMILAWMKLRRRNLAPILNANGWAINADVIVNVPFGATLTDQVQFPLVKINKKAAKEAAKKLAKK